MCELARCLNKHSIEHPCDAATINWNGIKGTPEETMGGIAKTLSTRLDLWAVEDVNDLTVIDEMDFDNIGVEKTAIFLIVPPADTTYKAICNMFYSQLFSRLMYCANFKHNGRLPLLVSVELDEFANIGRIPNFDKITAVIRSNNIRVCVVLQSLPQLKALYKDNWESIIGNCSLFTYLGAPDLETRKYIVEKLDKTTVRIDTRGHSQGTTSGGSSSDNESYQGRDLLTTSELLRAFKASPKIKKKYGGYMIEFLDEYPPFWLYKFDTLSHPLISKVGSSFPSGIPNNTDINKMYSDNEQIQKLKEVKTKMAQLMEQSVSEEKAMREQSEQKQAEQERVEQAELQRQFEEAAGKIQARLEKNHKKGLNFVPYHWMERERELEDLQERLSDTNCELFKIGVYISLSAATKDELDELTEAIRSKGKKHQVVIDCLVRQQEKALNSVLPFGINHFDTANGNSVNTYVLSDAAGILIPFSARSYFSDTGLCYGMNKHTNAIIVLDRAEEMNANGFILGTSGSGKSMYCKSEIIDTIIRYPKSEKIIIDPDGEYYPIIKQFGGDTLKLSADSETKINIFDTDINISENGTSAVAMKSELIMSIIETARGFPLSAADKSIIDSCVKEVYADYVLNNGNPEFIPTFVDFYNALINKKLPEADQIALDIELYVNGSFNTFSGKTNIHTDNKLLSIDISDMGEQLRPVGLQVILEYIWQRVRDNRTKGVQTWVWVDEFSIMFNDGNDKETVRSADFFQKVFKRIRKYGGIPTGITQNITEVLESGQARLMLSNSEFVVLLQQKKTDLDKVIELFNLSPSQSSYLKTGEKGTGLIVSGKKIIPFDRRISKDSSIYNLCQTDFRRDVT